MCSLINPMRFSLPLAVLVLALCLRHIDSMDHVAIVSASREIFLEGVLVRENA